MEHDEGPTRGNTWVSRYIPGISPEMSGLL